MNLTIPQSDFQAYLFDCDGTIADSMPLHHRAWNRALKDWNCCLDEELFYEWGGKPVRDVIAELARMKGLKLPVEEVAASKERYYKEQLPDLKAIPEVLEIIHEEHGKIPLAVVSGSKRDLVVCTLNESGIRDKFEILICAEDYKRGKIAPDGYLLAARALRVRPLDCLVLEDTDLGIQAATEAGMKSVLVAALELGQVFAVVPRP